MEAGEGLLAGWVWPCGVAQWWGLGAGGWGLGASRREEGMVTVSSRLK